MGSDDLSNAGASAQRTYERRRAGIGRGGVTVIDAKHMTGRVRIERRGGLLAKRTEILRVGGSDRTALIDKLGRQVDFVRELLLNAGFGSAPVAGALCLAKPDGLPLLQKLKIREMVVDGPRGVARLVARDGNLDEIQVEAIAALLSMRLPPA